MRKKKDGMREGGGGRGGTNDRIRIKVERRGLKSEGKIVK